MIVKEAIKKKVATIGIRPDENNMLQNRREGLLPEKGPRTGDAVRQGIGDVVLSPQQQPPSDGVILTPPYSHDEGWTDSQFIINSTWKVRKRLRCRA
jgi:hypothetical protein